MTRPSLNERPRIGMTPRPRGTGGVGAPNVDLGEWAQKLVVGFAASQIPVIDRPRSPVTGGPPELLLLNDAGAGCERSLYAVTVVPRELAVTLPGSIPTEQAILDTGRDISAAQIRVEWSMGGMRDNHMLLDVGAGFVMTLPAKRIQLSLLLPAGGLEIGSLGGQPIPPQPVDPVTNQGPSTWLAAVICGVVNRTQTYAAFAEWQLTRAMVVPAAASRTVGIPAGADFVEVLEISAGGPTPFLNFVNAAGNDVGQFSVNTSTARDWSRTRIPGHAREITSGPPTADSDRVLIVIFTMRP